MLAPAAPWRKRIVPCSEPDDSHTVAFDATGEPLPDWLEGVDPEPTQDARAPPSDWDGVDPPAPDG